MAFFFTFLYMFISFITPTLLFGPLGEFHLEIITVVLAMAFTIPNIAGTRLGRAPQTIAVAGMFFAVMVSIMANGWIGGARYAGYAFLQPALAFFLPAINCRTRKHLQWLVAGFFSIAVFFLAAGLLDLHNNAFPSPYIFGDAELPRLRGVGMVADPNDFAQVMVALMPLCFLWYRRGATARNLLLVGVPSGILLYGMYLTHSRGGALAIMAIIMLSSRRKIGTLPAGLLAGLLLAASLAGGWSGGREISMESGNDRLDLWSGGLQLIKSHPFFGIGWNMFADYMGITAHNSIVVCTAEIGTVGLYFWALLMLSSIRPGYQLGNAGAPPKTAEDEDDGHPWLRASAAPAAAVNTTPSLAPDLAFNVGPGGEAVALRAPTMRAPQLKASAIQSPGARTAVDADARPAFANQDTSEQLPDEEISRMARLLVYTLTAFLVAGWFLSRALSMWLFMFSGMMYAVLRMGHERNMTKDEPIGFFMRWAGVVAVTLVLIVYLMLRFRTL